MSNVTKIMIAVILFYLGIALIIYVNAAPAPFDPDCEGTDLRKYYPCEGGWCRRKGK